MIYYAKITKERAGEYFVEVLGLDGCFTEGRNISDALKNAREALNGWLMAHCDLEMNFKKFYHSKKHKGKNIYPIRADLNVEFAVRLRIVRQMKGITQTQAAKLLGVSQQAYAKLEQPKKSNPSLITLQKLVSALDLDIEFKMVG